MTRLGYWHRTVVGALLAITSLCGSGCTTMPGADSLAKLTPGGQRTASMAERMAEARALENADKLDEARDIYQKLIVESPDRYEPYHRLGVVADRQKRHREAEALYTQAIERQPTKADLFNDLGYCYYLQGKLMKAESAMLKAVAMSPSTPRYRNNLGLVLGHQGRYDDALEAFRKAGSEADAQYNMAFVRASQNEMEEAKACFRLALVADPTFEPAREMLDNFARVEADPEAELDKVAMAKDGVRWVPYVEPGGSTSAVTQANYTTTTASNAATSATSAQGASAATSQSRMVGPGQFGRNTPSAPGRLSAETMATAAPLF
ncbi:MAG: tetratricopeptide repeat protein [Pirellulales bacterium]|nr:tetratricopeptide repeat protein [Planctomycetales bacterium]